MYLAQEYTNGEPRYWLKISYPDEQSGVLCSRTLVDLGAEPHRFVVYPNERSFFIDQKIQEQIEAAGVEVCDTRLEELLWPFVSEEVRHCMEPFQGRGRGRRYSPLTDDDKELIRTRVHSFDKMRLAYLRLGSIDQQRMARSGGRLFRPLLHMSRDELEQRFLTLEAELEPREYKRYVFSIFGLDRFFTSIVEQQAPETIDQQELDLIFDREFCALLNDPSFWAGFDPGPIPHGYLHRYVIMFFDYGFSPSRFREEYWQEYINRRRMHRQPPVHRKVSEDEAKTLFGSGMADLKKMNKKDLTRLYRQRAKKLHPDMGGDQQIFVRLSEVYHGLLQEKKA